MVFYFIFFFRITFICCPLPLILTLLAGVAGCGAGGALLGDQTPARPTARIRGGIANGTCDVLALAIAHLAMALAQLAGGEEAHGGGAAALQDLCLGVAMRVAVLPMPVHHLVDALRHRNVAEGALLRCAVLLRLLIP